MKNRNQTKWKISTLISLICLIIPFSIYSLWIYVFNLGTTQAERVSVFKDYFPDFLDGRWSTTIISIIFSFSAVILSSINLKHSKKNMEFNKYSNSNIEQYIVVSKSIFNDVIFILVLTLIKLKPE